MALKTPLARVRGLGSAGSGTDHFWWQRVTAIANVPLVIIFAVVAISLVGADHETATARIAHPFVTISLLLLVLSVTYHMRLGMQVIIEDYVYGHGLKTAAIILNIMFCITLALVCAYAILNVAFSVHAGQAAIEINLNTAR